MKHRKSYTKQKNPDHNGNTETHISRVRFVFIILIFSILLLSTLIAINSNATRDSTSTSTASSGTDHPGTTRSRADEPDIIVDFSPKDPIHLDEVNVTITSTNGDDIIRASLFVTFIKLGEMRSGGYDFNMVDTTHGYVVIDGTQNQGETDVTFYVIAGFDEVDVRTGEFEYRVEYLGTWSSPVFSENIELQYSPTAPEPGGTVNVSIRSTDSLVPIKYAFLGIRVRFPKTTFDQHGAKNFTRVSSTFMFAEIPGYAGATNVTFWAEVYDEALTKLKSKEFQYTVKTPETDHAPQSLYVYVWDAAKKDYITNVNVTIYNNTWTYSNNDNKGVVWSPFALAPGVYNVKVKNGDEEIIQSVTIPNTEQDFSEIRFNFNVAKSKGLILDFEEFPPWFVIASTAIFILSSLMFFYFYYELRRRAREKERAVRRRIGTGGRRRVEEAQQAEQRSDTFWYPGMVIRKILEDEKYKITSFRILGFFLLGLFGATWAPFYPWWMVLVIGIIVAAIAYRFTYLSLLVLVLFVIASTAYQFPAFGWLFMIFAVIIAIISLFDWRFGFLVFMTLFISRLGIAFVVPVMSGLLVSMFMGLAVAISSGIFFTFMVTSGESTILSFFIGPTHEYGFIGFSKPILDNFKPTDITNALASLYKVDIDGLSTILQVNYTSMIPFIQIIIWTVMVFIVVYLIRKYAHGSITRASLISLAPSFILIITSFTSIQFYDQSINIGTGLLMVGIIGVMLSAIIFAFMNMELFNEFYAGKTKDVPIGTRIGEMMTLRKTGFTEIGGLEEIKRELKDTMIGPLLRPKKAREYGVEPPRGIMLFGPPGCGKTLLMRALATELNVEMIGVRCSDVMSKWYGESEGMIEKLFKAVKERRPCILFLDEIDAIAKRRDFYSADDVTPRLLSIMLSELDGMDEAAGVIVVGATNKPELVDPALMRPGRFDKIIFIPPPTYISRIEIFKIHLQGKPASPNLDIEHLAHSTDGYSGADIENLVKEAATVAMKRSITTRRATKITNSDFLKIIPRLKPSLTREMKDEYDKLQADFERKKYGHDIKLPPTEEAEEADFEVIEDDEVEESRETRRRRAPSERERRHAARRPPPPPSDRRGGRPVSAGVRGGRAPPQRKPPRRRERGIEPSRQRPAQWRNVAGLSHTKEFFKNAIENNLTGGK
jgi:AAA+ superfamily predicted ATPase